MRALIVTKTVLPPTLRAQKAPPGFLTLFLGSPSKKLSRNLSSNSGQSKLGKIATMLRERLRGCSISPVETCMQPLRRLFAGADPQTRPHSSFQQLTNCHFLLIQVQENNREFRLVSMVSLLHPIFRVDPNIPSEKVAVGTFIFLDQYIL